VIILFIIDFIGSLIEYIYVFDTNAFPLKYWDPERRGGERKGRELEITKGRM